MVTDSVLATALDDEGGRPPTALARLSVIRQMAPTPRELDRFLMTYQAALDEMTTKLEILRGEFTRVHDENPIEHVSARLKSVDGIVEKAQRLGCASTLDAVRTHVRDIAGVRVVCSFTSDVYRMFHLIADQTDVTVVEVKDYIARPKPSGYRSLHAIIEIPIFLSTGVEVVPVELQLRTAAMDFWASLEHKIAYKYYRVVPEPLQDELRDAASVAAHLDRRLQQLRREVVNGKALGQLAVVDSQPTP